MELMVRSIVTVVCRSLVVLAARTVSVYGSVLTDARPRLGSMQISVGHVHHR